MNITDIDKPTEIPEDIMGAIFQKQLELTIKYIPIEEKNGLLLTPDIPVNINCNKGQARIKAFAWYATEELVEAVDAKEDPTHYHEELIDAFHFMVELAILSGYKPNLIEYYYDNAQLTDHPYSIIHQIGMAAHKLKCKSWKQTHQLTDIARFYKNLDDMFFAFFGLMENEKLDAIDVYCLYFKKNAVNAFRQRSKY